MSHLWFAQPEQKTDSAHLPDQVYKENGLRGLYFGFSLHTLRDTVSWPILLQ